MVNAVDLALGAGNVVLVGEGRPSRDVLDLGGDKGTTWSAWGRCDGVGCHTVLQKAVFVGYRLGWVSLQTLEWWFWPSLFPGWSWRIIVPPACTMCGQEAAAMGWC